MCTKKSCDSNKRKNVDLPISNQVLSLTTTSCLGEVNPFFEPLKVGLDDDSSLEDNEFDEESVFFTDGDGEAMEILNNEEHVKSMFFPVSNSLSVTPSQSLSTGSLTCVSHDSSTESSGLKRCRSKRKVSLSKSVEVIPIPTRSEYSGHVKERLWSSATELHRNAARNSFEFASEGWNWRTATEDENMLVCKSSGEMIHPIHVLTLLHQTGINDQLRENEINSSYPQARCRAKGNDTR